jgi:hypothetical protein
MTRLFIAAANLVFLVVWLQIAEAQEEVTSTSGTGSESTASSTAGPSTGTTTGPSATTNFSSSAAPGAVSNAPNAAAAMQGPGGVGVFSPTPIKLYLSVIGGYDDNVNTNSGSRQGSGYSGGNAILDYTFGDPRLQVVLNAGAGLTYYFSHISNQDYDIDLKGAMAITYKASPRLTLGGSVLVSYLTEPTFQYAGGLNSRNGNYLYTTDTAYLQYGWSRRFATRTSYVFDAYNYDNNAVAAFSNRVSNLFGNEFRFQMVPTTSLVVEYRYELVSYDNSFLNSQSHYALGGIDHTFNPRLSATFRGGAQFRSYDNAGDRTGPYFEGKVDYALGRRTSVSWVSRYGIEEPDIPTAQSRTTFRTGLQTKFSLTSRVETGLDLFYVHDDYHALAPGTGGAFSEDTFDTGFSARYAINGQIGLQLSYHYTDVSSDAAFREYSRNRVSGGVSVTF